MSKLVLAEKPSVAQSIANVLGANKRCDGYLEGNGYIVSWCVGHLVELAAPEVYDEKYGKWRLEDLPIRYHADRPDSCRACYFYKNRKVGCILGKENCYYLAEVVKTEQEMKCEGCCYAKGQPCVSACCYKDLDKWLQERRKKAGDANE